MIEIKYNNPVEESFFKSNEREKLSFDFSCMVLSYTKVTYYLIMLLTL